MKKIDLNLGDVGCLAYGDDRPEVIMVQPLGEMEVKDFGTEASIVEKGLGGKAFLLVGMLIGDWVHELTPWADSKISKDPDLGDGARKTLASLLDEVQPGLKKLYPSVPMILGGYSLGGLFSLWAAAQTDVFQGIAASSPSLWIKDWDEFSEAHPPKAGCVYLSLGDTEERAKNVAIARVGDCVRRENQRLTERLGAENTTLVWNHGGHFQDGAARTAAGFVWCALHILK